MRRIHSLLILIVLGLVTRGQSASPSTLDQVAPLTDDLTVAVARLDLTNLSLDAVFQTLTNLTSDGKSSLLSAAEVVSRTAVKGWVTRFTEAGGRDVYLLFSLNDLGVEPPVTVVVPISDGANVEALRQLIVSSGLGAWEKCVVLKKCLVAAPTAILQRLETLQAAPPKNLQPAFAQTLPGALQAVFLPYESAGRVLDEVMPVLPSVMGGGSSDALSHGLRWATLSATSPPELSLQFAIQARTDADAEALRRTIAASLEAVGKLDQVRRELPQWETLATMLTPAVQGDRLILAWDRPRIEKLVKTCLAPMLVGLRQKDQAIYNLSNLKQIGLAVVMYATDHEDQLPSHLAATLPYLENGEPLLLPGGGTKCPPDLMKWDYPKQVEWLDQHGAYVYLKPAAHLKEIKEPDKTLLAYQRLETTDGTTVPAAFADGHTERLSREAFEKLLKKSQKPSP